jgi:hypothetical protein
MENSGFRVRHAAFGRGTGPIGQQQVAKNDALIKLVDDPSWLSRAVRERER